MDIVDPRIEEYVERLTSPHEPLLAELSEETARKLGSSQMLTGPVAGRLLEFLVWVGQSKRVLEIGTFSGHSALAMAGALPEGGHIDTCEVDPERAAVAQRYFDRSPHGSKITLHLGPATETIERLGGEFDLVFIDADKEGYIGYYEAVLPRLAERGLIPGRKVDVVEVDGIGRTIRIRAGKREVTLSHDTAAKLWVMPA